MTEKIDKSMFWNLRQTLTHNCLFNLIVGNRGGGKSYGAKEWGIDNFIKNREQFGYIRRYKDDLKQPMQQYFEDIKDQYPDYEFKTDKSKFYIRLKPADPKQKWTEDDVAGYGFILSTASNKKSISYPRITTLIFDEFLIEKGHVQYLPNEVTALLNLYETVARPGTGHPRVVLFLLANAITQTNPYFMFWGLSMPTRADKNGKYIWKHPTRPILVEDVRNAAFIDKKKNTEFGALISGTAYAEYSIENKMLQDTNTFIEKKDAGAKYYFTFVYKGTEYGVWINGKLGKMWVSYHTDPSYTLVYALTLKDHAPNTMFLKGAKKQTHFRKFIDNYKLGNVYFENMNIKNICYEVLQLVIN